MTGFKPPDIPPPTILKRSERGMLPILQAVIDGVVRAETDAKEPTAIRTSSSWLERKAERATGKSNTAEERKAKRDASLKLNPDINPARIDDDGEVWPYCYQDTSRLVLCCDCNHFADDACSRGKQCSLQAVGERAEIRRWLVPTPGNGYQCFAPLVSPTVGRVFI